MTHLITTSEKTQDVDTKYFLELKMQVFVVGFMVWGFLGFGFCFFSLSVATIHLYR